MKHKYKLLSLLSMPLLAMSLCGCNNNTNVDIKDDSDVTKPEVPETPDKPENPEKPENPDKPVDPDTPTDPNTPNLPKLPDFPKVSLKLGSQDELQDDLDTTYGEDYAKEQLKFNSESELYVEDAEVIDQNKVEIVETLFPYVLSQFTGIKYAENNTNIIEGIAFQNNTYNINVDNISFDSTVDVDRYKHKVGEELYTQTLSTEILSLVGDMSIAKLGIIPDIEDDYLSQAEEEALEKELKHRISLIEQHTKLGVGSMKLNYGGTLKGEALESYEFTGSNLEYNEWLKDSQLYLSPDKSIEPNLLRAVEVIDANVQKIRSIPGINLSEVVEDIELPNLAQMKEIVHLICSKIMLPKEIVDFASELLMDGFASEIARYQIDMITLQPLFDILKNPEVANYLDDRRMIILLDAFGKELRRTEGDENRQIIATEYGKVIINHARELKDKCVTPTSKTELEMFEYMPQIISDYVPVKEIVSYCFNKVESLVDVYQLKDGSYTFCINIDKNDIALIKEYIKNLSIKYKNEIRDIIDLENINLNVENLNEDFLLNVAVNINKRGIRFSKFKINGSGTNSQYIVGDDLTSENIALHSNEYIKVNTGIKLAFDIELNLAKKFVAPTFPEKFEGYTNVVDLINKR